MIVFNPIHILKKRFLLISSICLFISDNSILSMDFMKKRFNITIKMECYYVYKKYIYTKLENPNELTKDISTNTAFYLNLFNWINF